MALTTCTECQKQVSSNATACPHCGNPLGSQPAAKEKKSTGSVTWIALILILVGVFWYLPKVSREENLPAMPVAVKTRPALTGPGLVLVVKNTSSRYLTYMVTLKNPTTAQEKSFRLDAAPSGDVEIGHKEGWALSSGDIIKIVHSEYQSWGGNVP